jgi:RimJ/RimL family protein N-acetyltransferase
MVLPETLQIRRRGLVLRDWRDSDAKSLEAVCGEQEVCRFTTVPWSYSEAEAIAWIDGNRRRRSEGKVLSLAIAEREEDLALGNVNLSRFANGGREAALGYWLVPFARGRGLAFLAAAALTAWGFEMLGLKRVELAILPGNLASRRVAERIGACSEGVRRMSHQAEGRWWDMAIYSLEPPGGHATR